VVAQFGRDDLNTIGTQFMSGRAKSLPPPKPNPLDFVFKSEMTFHAWTGIFTPFFKVLLKLVEATLDEKCGVSSKEQLLIFLIKLKSDLSFPALAALAQRTPQFVVKYFNVVLAALYQECLTHNFWLDKKTIEARMPPTFKRAAPNTRILIDAAEIQTEAPPGGVDIVKKTNDNNHCDSDKEADQASPSFKFLLGMAPSGEITYYSKVFEGRTSNTQMVRESALLDMLEEGDQVLADTKFPQIVDRSGCGAVGARVVVPPEEQLPFPEKNNRLSQQDATIMSKLRKEIVQGTIRKIKKFRILKFSEFNRIEDLDRIISVLCFFVNNMSDFKRTKRF